jgi:hypothetical protein
LFKSKKQAQKTSYPLYDALAGGQARSQDGQYAAGDRGAAQVAAGVEEVYAALQARLRALNSFNWEIRRMQSDTYQDDDEILWKKGTRGKGQASPALAHALQAFHIKNKFTLFHIWYYCKLVTGKAFLAPVKNMLGKAEGLEWYNPLAMQIIAPTGTIQGYRYNGQGGMQSFTAEEIVYDYMPSLLKELEGQSPVEILIDNLNIDRTIRNSIKAYFKNGMKVGAVVSPRPEGDGYIDTAQIDHLIRRMESQRNSPSESYSNIYLPYGVHVDFPTQQGYGPVPSISEDINKKVHKVLNVPANVTGDMGDTRYKEGQDAYAAWVALNVLPDARGIEDVVNLHLMPFFDPGGDTYFKFDEGQWSSRVTQAHLDKQAAARADLEVGAITVRQYNHRLGIVMTEEEEAELDVRLVPSGVVVVRRGELGAAITDDVVMAEPGQASTAQVDKSAQAELAAWRKWVRKAKSPPVRAFDFVVLRADVVHHIQKALEENTDIEDIYQAAKSRLACDKAIQATRLNFEMALEDIIAEARTGTINHNRFTTLMRHIIERHGRQAYIDGLVDGGLIGGGADDDDQQAIAQMIKAQSAYVSAFAATLFKGDGISDSAATHKSLLWWNKSIKPFYDAGLMSANENEMLEFAGDDGEESCSTCHRLKGQRHRAK